MKYQAKKIGEIQTTIQGMQYTVGIVQPGEPVVLERQPDHPHDPYAILVKNQLFEPVGYLPREMTFWMASLIDDGKIRVDAAAPNEVSSFYCSRHLGFPVVCSIYLTEKGKSILEINPSPMTDKEFLHDTIRSMYHYVKHHDDEDFLHELQQRIRSVSRRDLLPETYLLLSLIAAKTSMSSDEKRIRKIDSIRDYFNHYRLGEPIHHRNLTVYPLLNGSRRSLAQYDLISEALDAGTAEIEEASKAGRVHEVTVRNHGSKPVLIPEGQILVGAKQNRIINISVMIGAKQTTPIPVSCVERRRWQYSSDKFNHDCCAHPHLRHVKLKSVHRFRRQTGEARSDQAEVWEEVAHQLSEAHIHSQTESITDHYKTYEDSIREFNRHFKLPKRCYGVVVCTGQQVLAMDCFDSDATFTRCWEKLFQSYMIQALSQPVQLEKTPVPVAEEFLRKVREGFVLCEKPIGIGDEFMIEGDALTGTGVWYSDSICHMAAFTQIES